MPTSFLEIVELPDGRIVLRRAEDEEVLVTLDFSDDAKLFLQGQHVEIAKAMFNVGVQMAGRDDRRRFRPRCRRAARSALSAAAPGSAFTSQQAARPCARRHSTTQTNIQALRPAQAGGVAQLAACRVVDLAEPADDGMAAAGRQRLAREFQRAFRVAWLQQDDALAVQAALAQEAL